MRSTFVNFDDDSMKAYPSVSISHESSNWNQLRILSEFYEKLKYADLLNQNSRPQPKKLQLDSRFKRETYSE